MFLKAQLKENRDVRDYIAKILICRQIILASQSPRRLEILKQIGLQCTVNVSRFQENLDKSKMTPVFTVYHEFHLG